jgi:hypothetical protein
LAARIEKGQLAGWRVFRLPDGIRNKATFFGAIKEVLPLDPPLGTGLKWDALADSIWGGLDDLETDRVLVYWPSNAQMALEAPDDFTTASEIFESIARTLSDPRYTDGEPTFLAVVVGLMPSWRTGG